MGACFSGFAAQHGLHPNGSVPAHTLSDRSSNHTSGVHTLFRINKAGTMVRPRAVCVAAGVDASELGSGSSGMWLGSNFVCTKESSAHNFFRYCAS